MTGKVMAASAELADRLAEVPDAVKRRDAVLCVMTALKEIDSEVELGELLFVMENATTVAREPSRMFQPTATAFLHGFLLGLLTQRNETLAVLAGSKG